VLKPLLRKGSAFYGTWDPLGNRDLADSFQRKEYIEYSVKEIKRLLAGCSQNLQNRWKPVAQGGILSTTVVGGLLLLLERLAEAGQVFPTLDYPKLLTPVQTFDFSPYKSSGWAQLSKDLLAKLTL
jgi:hypothetical protein